MLPLSEALSGQSVAVVRDNLGKDVLAPRPGESFFVDVTEGIKRGVVLVTELFRR